MAQTLKAGDFESLERPLVVEAQVGTQRVTVELRVASVARRSSHRLRDEPFAVTLTGPRAPALPQGTYRVQHPQLGFVELFLVPSAQHAQSTEYELTFN